MAVGINVTTRFVKKIKVNLKIDNQASIKFENQYFDNIAHSEFEQKFIQDYT